MDDSEYTEMYGIYYTNRERWGQGVMGICKVHCFIQITECKKKCIAKHEGFYISVKG